MSIEMEKAKDLASYSGSASIGRDSMKSDIKEQLLRDFDLLSEEKKRLVAEYANSLTSKAAPLDDAAKQERRAKRLHALAEMDKVAVEIGKHWKEDIDAAELVSSMRR